MNSPFRPSTTPEKLRLTVEDFLLLDESGAFDAYQRTELIDGEIYVVNAQHTRHSRFQSLLLTELNIALRALGSDLEALVQPSTRLSDHDLPEPDIVLTRYRGDGPVPLASVALLVEVAHTSQAFDKGPKLKMYSAAGIAEYWLADVEAMIIFQHTAPGDGGFGTCHTLQVGERIAAVTIPGLEVPTDLLG